MSMNEDKIFQEAYSRLREGRKATFVDKDDPSRFVRVVIGKDGDGGRLLFWKSYAFWQNCGSGADGDTMDSLMRIVKTLAGIENPTYMYI